MKNFAVLACLMALVGCAKPTITISDTTPRAITFRVRDPSVTPRQLVDEQAAGYCRQQGLDYRPMKSAPLSPSLIEMSYDCTEIEAPPPPAVDEGRKQARPTPAAATKRSTEEVKTTAWARAKTAADAWALCLRFGAERKAKESQDVAQLVAVTVVNACSGPERAVYEPLQAIGEASKTFQADMHAQALQNAADTVTDVREKASVPAGGTATSPTRP